MTKPNEQVMARAAITEQLVIELARECVDAYILDQTTNLPDRLWSPIETDSDMNVTDIALAAVDLFGFLIDHVGRRHGLEESAAILDAVATEHRQSIAALAERMNGTAR